MRGRLSCPLFSSLMLCILPLINFGQIQIHMRHMYLVAWHSGRTLVFDRRTFAVLRSTCRLQLDVPNLNLGRRHLANAYEVKAGIVVIAGKTL